MIQHYHGEGMWTALAASAGITISTFLQSSELRAFLANLITTVLVGTVVGVLKARLKPTRRKPRKKTDHVT